MESSDEVATQATDITQTESTQSETKPECSTTEAKTSFVMPGKDKQLEKVEDLDQEAIQELKTNVATITSIKLSGHSYGLEACQHIGDILADATKLTHVDFSNCFIGKLKDQIPENLKALLKNLEGRTNIYLVDLSDNAFGPAGVPGFETFIKNTPSIKVLNMINCGLGPMGGTSLAEFLKASQVKLFELRCGRNRLENKGFSEIAAVVKEMGTLKTLEVPQNFVKEGMIEMIQALQHNPDLEFVHIHDNWLKEGAIDELVTYLKSHAKNIKSLNFSDCDIGGLGVKKIIRALGNGASRETIEYIYLNYNDVERTKTHQFIFDVFRACKSLKSVSYIGNLMKSELKNKLVDQFKASGQELTLIEPSEDDEEMSDEEDDGEELSDEDEEGDDDDQDGAKQIQDMLNNLSLE